jgi:isoleucyl-tRNA synthetase
MVTRYNHEESEDKILKFWVENKIYQKSKERGKDKPKFYFLQGPPYTSGKLHIGHAWNNSSKDVVLRYKRMRGYDVWDRAGYDMHGLPTANKVQKQLGLKDKDAIIEYGMDKFVEECKAFSIKYAKLMDEDLFRLGIWMDYENAYYPIRNEFIEGEWYFIKKANEKNRLYKGKKVMTWCGDCETALAKHELEYEEVTDKSIFLKFKIESTEDEFLVIWTTTPWTIPYNLAVMVNPVLDYVKIKVKDEVWIVAKDLAESVVKNLNLNKKEEEKIELDIIEEFKGKELEGVKYTHPFKDKIDFETDSEKLHTVLLSEEHVDTSAGSGLVHCAPGCGPEDYEVGMANGLKPFNKLNEKGEFVDMGEFSGMKAKLDDKKFIELLDMADALVTAVPVKHDYAHCWRCHKPVIFKTTEQWFLKVEDLTKEILDNNKDVNWFPEESNNSYERWVDNLKDNTITRQRFWGCPVPTNKGIPSENLTDLSINFGFEVTDVVLEPINSGGSTPIKSGLNFTTFLISFGFGTRIIVFSFNILQSLTISSICGVLCSE